MREIILISVAVLFGLGLLGGIGYLVVSSFRKKKDDDVDCDIGGDAPRPTPKNEVEALKKRVISLEARVNLLEEHLRLQESARSVDEPLSPKGDDTFNLKPKKPLLEDDIIIDDPPKPLIAVKPRRLSEDKP